MSMYAVSRRRRADRPINCRITLTVIAVFCVLAFISACWNTRRVVYVDRVDTETSERYIRALQEFLNSTNSKEIATVDDTQQHNDSNRDLKPTNTQPCSSNCTTHLDYNDTQTRSINDAQMTRDNRNEEIQLNEQSIDTVNQSAAPQLGNRTNVVMTESNQTESNHSEYSGNFLRHNGTDVTVMPIKTTSSYFTARSNIQEEYNDRRFYQKLLKTIFSA